MEKIFEIITFNVGGTKFSFSKDTISKNSKDSYFGRLINGSICSTEKDDKDPEIFKIIAQYLRGYYIDFNKKTSNNLRLDADYFGLSDLVNKIDEEFIFPKIEEDVYKLDDIKKENLTYFHKVDGEARGCGQKDKYITCLKKDKYITCLKKDKYITCLKEDNKPVKILLPLLKYKITKIKDNNYIYIIPNKKIQKLHDIYRDIYKSHDGVLSLKENFKLRKDSIIIFENNSTINAINAIDYLKDNIYFQGYIECSIKCIECYFECNNLGNIISISKIYIPE